MVNIVGMKLDLKYMSLEEIIELSKHLQTVHEAKGMSGQPPRGRNLR